MSHAATLDRFARAVLDPSVSPPAGLIGRHGAIDLLRFAVYRNNVHVGLVGALEARFPVTRRIVGDAFFRLAARTFVGRAKPESPLLFAYGDGFPDHLAALPEAGHLPYLADVARLEALWTRAYGAADVLPMAISDLATIAAEHLADCRAAFHPSAGWLRSAYPVASIWTRHQQTQVEPFTLGTGENVLVLRPEAEVLLHCLDAATAAFTGALLAGWTLGDAAEAAARMPDFDFGTALIGLVRIGALVRLTPDREA